MLLITLALTACIDPAPDAPQIDTGVDAAAPAVPAEIAAPAPEGAQETADGFSSTYSDFAIEACTVVRQEREEGTSTDWTCPPAGGVAVFAQEGDGRMDLDFGVDDGGFQTYGGFNTVGKTIEWRRRDGKAFAGIFRYTDASPQGAGMTVLAVETIGTASAKGCRLAQIAGDAPDPNARARAIADGAFGKTSCPPTQYVGRYAR